MDNFEREELRSARRTSQEKEVKKDYYSVITTVQTVLSLILIVAVIIISKSGGETSKKLKNDFARLMNYSVIEVGGANAVQTVKEFLSEPFSLLPSLNPVEKIEESQVSEETEETTDEASTTEENETTEPEEEKETETKPLEETKAEEPTTETNDMGGVDIELYKAADGASFSPVATTSVVLSPVSSERYTSYFGYRKNPITNKRSFHTGLDIAAPLGTKIRAAYNGTVRKTGEDGRSGKYIFLTHDDGFETFYCHCSEILAEKGAVIRQGETIALVGSTGWSTGPHLHFEVRKNGERLNPLGILKDGN